MLFQRIKQRLYVVILTFMIGQKEWIKKNLRSFVQRIINKKDGLLNTYQKLFDSKETMEFMKECIANYDNLKNMATTQNDVGTIILFQIYLKY